MAKKKKGKFSGKTSQNAKERSSGASYGYLNLPSGISVLKIEDLMDKHQTTLFDVIPYEVTDKKHPDRNEEVEIAVEGEIWYKRPFKIHRNVGVDKDSVVCLRSFGEKCPVCEYREELRKDDGDEDEIKSLRASDRNLYVVIPKGSKKVDEELHIFDYSDYLFQKLLEEEIQTKEEYENFPDLEEGKTLRTRWSEEKIGKNTFYEASRIDFDDRKKPYKESILKKVPNLDEVLQRLSYKDLKAKFFEQESDEDQEDEAPKRKKKSGKGKEKEKETVKKGKGKNKCPFDYRFGKDCEKHDECDDCKKWEACIEASEKK